MTSEEAKKATASAKGFAGLMSMASSVGTVGSVLDERRSDQTSGKMQECGTDIPSPSAPVDEPKSNSQLHQGAAPGQSILTPAGKWAFVLCAGIGVLWWLIASTNSDAPGAGRSSQSTSIATTTPSFDQLGELLPPVGTTALLSSAQIRYCLSEDIRIDAAGDALNKYLQVEVARFNAMIDDYNSRCSHFRYRSGSLEIVRAEVERNRPTLEAEGRARFAR